MGFSSIDDMVNKMSNLGQSQRIDWQKNYLTVAATAGECHCLANGAGNPTAATIYNTGTNLAFQAVSESTVTAGGMYHGGDKSPATKHIINVVGQSAALTSCPAALMLVDLLGFYRVTTVTTTGAQATNNAVTLPRYTNGVGVMPFAFVNSATAMGAATPTLTLGYTNSDGTTGRTTAGGVCKTAAGNGIILYSGTGAGKYNPYLPLQQGDKGVRSINTIGLSVSYVSGEFSVGLCKPITSIPLTTIGIATERDLVNQMPALPKIEDGACLVWILYSGAATPANTSYLGSLDVAWGS